MQILNKVSHENLVKCYYVFSDEKFYYFVMEFVAGGDAEMLFHSYKLRDEIIKQFIAEISIGLNYLHLNNIFHKDIKPKNILITKDVR